MIFDSHTHYDDKAFDDDRGELLCSLPDKGICGVVNVGTDVLTSNKSIELAKNYDYIYAAVGIHPQCVTGDNVCDIEEIKKIAQYKEVVAIGEIGLDYYYDKNSKDIQIEVFKKQIEISLALNLPILVHDRDAHQDTLSLLREYRPKGVVHCFSGSLEMAGEILKIGMYIGVGGVVTFKNSQKLVEVCNNIPIQRIILETDAPYLAPVPHRGKRCDSSHIKYTAQKIADIRGIPYEEVVTVAKNNAISLFNLTGDLI